MSITKTKPAKSLASMLRKDALAATREVGRLSLLPLSSLAAHLECAERDANDAFDVAYRAAAALCEAADVSRRDSDAAWRAGQRDTRRSK